MKAIDRIKKTKELDRFDSLMTACDGAALRGLTTVEAVLNIELWERLQSLGYRVVLSRTNNGGLEYVKDNYNEGWNVTAIVSWDPVDINASNIDTAL